MGFMGGGGMAGGWSSSFQGSHGPGGRRGLDGWNDEDLGKLYDQKVVRRLIPYLKPYPLQAVGAIIGVIGYAICSFSQPLLIGFATQSILAGDMNALNRDALILGAAALAAWGFQYLQLTCSGYMGHRLLLQLRMDMFNHLQRLSLSFYDRHEVGRVMSRVTSDVTAMQELMTSGMLTVLSDIAGLIVVVVILLRRDP